MPADFAQIHLLPVEASALRRYARKKRIPLDAPHVDALRGHGFLCLDCDPLDSPRRRKAAWYAVTPDGFRYLYYLDGQRRDRRWTRGLAIAAIIISLFALLLELDDRGFFGTVFRGFRSGESVAPVSQGR